MDAFTCTPLSVRVVFGHGTLAQVPGEEARYAKLAVNLMIAVSSAMMGESIALGRKSNIGWAGMLKVLTESAVASPMVKYKAATLGPRLHLARLLPADGQGSRSHPRRGPRQCRRHAARRVDARDLRGPDRPWLRRGRF